MENTPIPVKPPQSENSVAWEKNAAEVLVEDAGVPKIDLAAEKRLIRKQDLIMMPLLWTTFYVAYLVRGESLISLLCRSSLADCLMPRRIEVPLATPA